MALFPLHAEPRHLINNNVPKVTDYLNRSIEYIPLLDSLQK